MHPSMLRLVERLVIAMETMSQDVKNMSAYVYDLSCSVSYLVNERRENESISVAACGESDNPLSVMSSTGQGASAESEYSGQYEQADKRSSSHIGVQNHADSSFGDTASMSIDPHGDSDILSSVINPIFIGGIKMEDEAEVEASDESGDQHNIYADSRNNIRLSEDMRSGTQSETEREDQSYDLHTTISHSMRQLMPSESTARIEFSSNPVPREIQCVETPSHSAVSSDHTAFVSRLPEGLTSRARTRRMEIAKHALTAHRSIDSEHRPFKCLLCEKSFKLRIHLQKHTWVHSGEKPYKCNVCGRAFRQSTHLTVHMRSHTGETPYKCNLCGKAFRHRPSLTHHMHTHTGEIPYKCNLCGEAFRQHHSLTQHKRKHSQEHPS